MTDDAPVFYRCYECGELLDLSDLRFVRVMKWSKDYSQWFYETADPAPYCADCLGDGLLETLGGTD